MFLANSDLLKNSQKGDALTFTLKHGHTEPSFLLDFQIYRVVKKKYNSSYCYNNDERN